MMSRSVSTFTVAFLLLFTSFAIFASAAPTNVTCGDHDGGKVPVPVKDVPPVPENPPTNTTTNTTVVDDGTDDDTVVDPAVDATLATSSTTHSGTATWYEVGLGACGYTDSDSDFVVALNQPDWDSKSHCNQKLQITNPKNGRTKTATVRDLCPGCSSGDLDMSPSLFKALADDLGLGVFKMTWKYS